MANLLPYVLAEEAESLELTELTELSFLALALTLDLTIFKE